MCFLVIHFSLQSLILGIKSSLKKSITLDFLVNDVTGRRGTIMKKTPNMDDMP